MEWYEYAIIGLGTALSLYTWYVKQTVTKEDDKKLAKLKAIPALGMIARYLESRSLIRKAERASDDSFSEPKKETDEPPPAGQ